MQKSVSREVTYRLGVPWSLVLVSSLSSTLILLWGSSGA